jgi:hypothetical protein
MGNKIESKELLKICNKIQKIKIFCITEQLYEIIFMIRDIEKKFISGDIDATDENFEKQIIKIIEYFQGRNRMEYVVRDLKLMLLLEF